MKFRLTNTADQPISATAAASLAAANDVKATLSGPGITTVSPAGEYGDDAEPGDRLFITRRDVQ